MDRSGYLLGLPGWFLFFLGAGAAAGGGGAACCGSGGCIVCASPSPNRWAAAMYR